MTQSETTEGIETAVADMFEEILGNAEPVDVASDFFELGGSSILGARLVARIRQRFGVKVTIRDVFRARTVGAIAQTVVERSAAR